MQNPRPRKYASDAERQAAYRNRASMVEFRADEKTAEKLTEIADTLDISRSDLLLSMVKFALTNHQWARFGLTHKTLPRYEENPMATKKFSPAQIAAQKLFAERARAGTLGKTVKRKANPSTNTGLAIYLDAIAQGDTYSESKLMEALEHPSLSASDRTVIRAAIKGAPYSHIKLQDAAMKIRNYMGGRKTNPDLYSGAYAKAQKAALSAKDGSLKFGNDVYNFKFDKNEWVYKVTDRNGNYVVNVNEKSLSKAKSFLKDYLNNPISAPKRNPDKSKPRAYVKRASQATGAPPSKRLVTRRKMALKAPAGYFPNPEPTHNFARIGKPFAFGDRTWKVSQYSHNGKTIEAYTTDRKKFIRREFDVSELMMTRRKANPAAAMMTGYQVICMHPKKHVVGVFRTMAEAKQIATALANAKGVAYGVKAVKVHKAHFAA